MKKMIISVIMCVSLIFTFIVYSSALPSGEAHGWYFRKCDGGIRPCLPDDLSFINDYSAKWIGEDEKVIYLTFDAGYENGNVARILDALKDKNAVGTFFILENLVRRNPELVMRMQNEGHTIGNHTMKHPDLTKIHDRSIMSKEVIGLEALCLEKLGIEISKYFRPPQGRFSEECMEYLEKMGEKSIFWSFAYADWDNGKQPDPEKAIENIISHTHNGMVILLHPTSATNAQILPVLLDKWTEMGYRFGSADELFGKK